MMKLPKTIFLFCLALLFISITSCSNQNNSKDQKAIMPEQGKWLMKMDLGKVSLPFNFELNKIDSAWQMVIHNAEERIEVNEIAIRNDSMIVQMPVFESSFYLQFKSKDTLIGEWINYYKSADYKVPVLAFQTSKSRFSSSETNQDQGKLFEKYEATFSPGLEEEYKAIGLFEKVGQKVFGTFATETGDYRYLEGNIIGDSLYLSTFDGSHAFYFSALIQDSSLEGTFYSGTHFEEAWIARVNPDFELRDPDSLTFSKSEEIPDFELLNAEGEKISLGDPAFQNKVKIIQIMGSWCPNCLDESAYYKELYDRYQADGLEIIAIAFERTKSRERALKNLQRLQEKVEMEYELLLGGYQRDQHPTDLFPNLNHIMSYPTSLFLDRNNKIRKIHTGFYGPGTGSYFDEYSQETEDFVEALLKNRN